MEEFSDALKNSDTQDQLESIDEKLSAAIDLYAKRNQVEELINYYIEAFKSCDHDILWMPKTLQSFKMCCKGLHFKTILNIWSVLINELKAEQSEEINPSELQNVGPLAKLITEFLKNVSLDQVPESSCDQLVSCFVETQKLAVHFIRSCLKLKITSQMGIFFNLLKCTGDQILTLNEDNIAYKQFISHLECHEGHFTNMSSIFVGFFGKLSLKIHQMIISNNDKIALWSWENLLLLKLKFILMTDPSKVEILQSLNEFIFDLCEKITFDQQDGLMATQWSILCRSYYLLYKVYLLCKGGDKAMQYTHNFSRKVVQSLYLECGVYQDISRKFIVQIATSQMADFYIELCSGIFQKINDAIREKTKGAKRKLISKELSCANSVLDLMDFSIGRLLEVPMEDSVLVHLHKLLLLNREALVDGTYKNKENHFGSGITNLIKILSVHMSRFLNTEQKLKCTIVAMVAISCKELCNDEVLTCCLNIINCCFHSFKCIMMLLKFISPDDFCRWILCLHDFLPAGQDKNLCKQVFSLFLPVVLKNSSEVKRTKPFFNTVCKTLKSCKDSDFDQEPNQDFQHLLSCTNIMSKALNQGYVKPVCLRVLNKLMKKFVKTICFYLENLNKSVAKKKQDNENFAFINDNLDAAVCLLKGISLPFNINGNSEPEEQNNFDDDDDDDADVGCFVVTALKRNISQFQKCALIALESAQDLETVHKSLAFLKEFFGHQKNLDSNVFLLRTWKTLIERMRHCDEEPVANGLSSVASILLKNMDKKNFLLALEEMFQELDAGETNWSDVKCYLKLWQDLSEESITDDVQEVFIYSLQHVIMSIERLILKSPPPSIVASMLKTFSTSVQYKPECFGAQELSIVLHFVSSVNLELFPMKSSPLSPSEQLHEFLTVFESYYDVLNSLLNYHPDVVHSMIPTFLFGIKKLLQASMWAGQQQSDAMLSTSDLESLSNSAMLVSRLASLMKSEHKLHFNKVVHYLVAEFADCLQRVTLYPIVKRALTQAVYAWMDMCNEYTTAQLQVNLPSGAKEIFRDISSDYQKYHKYKGKIQF